MEHMKQIILGTAGHVDHGKTSLIKAITGIDTDRLKEEKRRGITIELGFASLDLPGGQHIGIVDVPGHEKFVKNMVAGVTGIDMVAMVIAADEGVMPQTLEHMEICTLLDVKFGLVVLTKIDMVDDEWLQLVEEDVRSFTKGTFLEKAPIVPVSSTTGQGLDHFIRSLGDLSADIPDRAQSSLFRLPVDRVFSMKGFGTVITGTLISGALQVGDTVRVYPGTIAPKVRGIQVHNKSVDRAAAGMRTAINLQGVEKGTINRGDVVAKPKTLKPTYMLDVMMHFLKSNPKATKNRTRVRFHAGTNEVMGNLVLLENEELVPGETTVVQLRLDSPVTAVKGDRFVVRSYSPIRTIGGGHVLNPIPPKHKRFKSNVIEGLKTIAVSNPETIMVHHIKESGHYGIVASDLLLMTNLSKAALNRILDRLVSKKEVAWADKDTRRYIHSQAIENIESDITGYLQQYHDRYPLKTGMPKEELKSKFPTAAVESKLFNLGFNDLLLRKIIFQEEETVRMATHVVSLKGEQSKIKKKIMDIYETNGLTPPYFKDISSSLNLDPSTARDILMVLVNEGHIIKVKDDLFFNAVSIEDLKRRLVDFLKQHKEITTPQVKELTGVSRKYVIPLIEYFDANQITIRIGDIRKLRARNST